MPHAGEPPPRPWAAWAWELSTLFVLICSNVVISMVKSIIPDKVRIPAFIVIIATFVTILQLCMQAYLPELYATLGLFIPLIVVNCILLVVPRHLPPSIHRANRSSTDWASGWDLP